MHIGEYIKSITVEFIISMHVYRYNIHAHTGAFGYTVNFVVSKDDTPLY